MPIAIGGLALPPSKIGLILALQSVAIALFQILFFAKLIRRFGERRVMIGGMSMYLFIFAFISIISITARESGLTIIVWALVGCLLSFSVIADMCFGTLRRPIFYWDRVFITFLIKVLFSCSLQRRLRKIVGDQ
jgi:MFS family permease